ncbi:MAG: hypothetical protein AB1Y25_04795 [Cycloclasticus sp.]
MMRFYKLGDLLLTVTLSLACFEGKPVKQGDYTWVLLFKNS